VYPDARWNGLPMWGIIALKRFRCIAVLGPGQRYLCGGVPSRA
jgi:hypothetical protein